MPLSRAVLARRVRLGAPFEFHGQMIVLEFLFRGEVAELLPADADHTVRDAEDLVRIIVFPVAFEKSIEAR